MPSSPRLPGTFIDDLPWVTWEAWNTAPDLKKLAAEGRWHGAGRRKEQMPQLKQHGVQKGELLCWTRKAGAGWWVTQLYPALCDPMDDSPQATLSLGFSRQEHWSGLPCPPPEDLPNPEMEPASLMPPALAGGFFATSNTWEGPQGKQSPTERRKTSSSRLARAQSMGDCHNLAHQKPVH